jgi:hypothetical protein
LFLAVGKCSDQEPRFIHTTPKDIRKIGNADVSRETLRLGPCRNSRRSRSHVSTTAALHVQRITALRPHLRLPRDAHLKRLD